jgi:hypothetical protein
MNNLIEITNCDELPLTEVFSSLKENTFSIIRGIIEPESIKNSVSILKSKFNPVNDHPSTGEMPKDIMNNFQKLSTGGESNRYNNFPRFFRTLYNPMWSEDIYKMRNIFRQVARLRNQIYGLSIDFAINDIAENGYWTASRIHQYPLGGGFFIGHRDTTLLDVAKEKGTGFFQIILVMSKKGIDFETGGAFIEDKKGDRLNIDDSVEIGDIIVYDGQTFHGVEDIDPHRKLSLDVLNGRLAGFVSLYKKMS